MEQNQKLPSDLEAKLNGGREYRKVQTIEARKGDDGKCPVEGYATTFNEQYLLFDFGDYRVYEQIDPKAFDECDMTDVIMQFDHNGRVFARTRNKTLELTVDKHGLKVNAELSGTALGRGLYEDINGGYIDRMSFGFRVSEDKREITEDRDNGITTVVRTITKISKLYDVSAVSLPANDGTEISARSFSDGVIAELKAERQRAEETRAQNDAKKKKIKLLCEV